MNSCLRPRKKALVDAVEVSKISKAPKCPHLRIKIQVILDRVRQDSKDYLPLRNPIPGGERGKGPLWKVLSSPRCDLERLAVSAKSKKKVRVEEIGGEALQPSLARRSTCYFTCCKQAHFLGRDQGCDNTAMQDRPDNISVLLGVRGGVGTSGSKRCCLHEDQAQDILDRHSCQEDGHIVRNALVHPTASSTAIQAQVAPSLGNSVSSRTIRRRLAEGHLESRCPLRVLPLTLTHRRLRFEWCCARGTWTAEEWDQVVFSDESRFNLSSDDNRVRVWRPHGERGACLCFTVTHRYHSWCDVMGYHCLNTRSPLVLIRGPMTAKRYVQGILQSHVLPLMQRLPGASCQFLTRQCPASHVKGVIRLSPHCYYPSLTCPIPIFSSIRTYLGLFGTASWASLDFERTRAKITANMERNVSRHHTELESINARSYRIVHSR
ncbi:transposable element Tcb1 transposase [Trichonephila clavipes]|nr:transposable element Tcb1 transposase [Trichonephila clavipes]